MVNIEHINLLNQILKTFLIVICTYLTYRRIINKQKVYSKIDVVTILLLIPIAILIAFMKSIFNSFIGNFVLIILLSFMCSLKEKESIEKSFIVNAIALSLNYIVLFFTICITYIINKIRVIENDSVNLIITTIIYFNILYFLSKIKRIKNGISYLNDRTNNELLNIIIFNLSIIISFMFSFFFSMDIKKTISKEIVIIFMIFSTIIFLTIKKSIQAYYKQKLLVQDLNETKKELEDKKKEVEELEKENLGFNKRSHSLAYKQKSLEFKLNKLLMKSEFADELGLTDEFKKISKQMKENEKLPKLDTTGILEVDDMLNMMQEECRLNDIDFSLQIKGNIYQMTNNYIDKEDLATLLADHIKDAIIAINHTDNLNKSIMVRLGKIDDCFAVYFYDSGVEFPEEIFNELGERPITAYANEGGTGLGFMNTFDVLRKKNASLIVENLGKPSIDNYTKIIKIIFDNNNKIMFDKTKIL